jgi:predicted phosphodiesterase
MTGAQLKVLANTPDDRLCSVFPEVSRSKLREIKRGLCASVRAKAPNRALKSGYVVSDAHIPYHDPDVWNLNLQVISQTSPDYVVIIGDLADNFKISSHLDTSQRKRHSFKFEIEECNRQLDRLQSITARTGSEVIYLEGNHEWRFDRYLASNAAELKGLVTMEGLLGIPDRGWEWVPYRQHKMIGDMAFTHDLGFSGANAGRQSLASIGAKSCMFGHTHRLGASYITVDGQTFEAINIGWGGLYNEIDYAHMLKIARNWQHGAGWFRTDGERTTGWPVRIDSGTCIIEGIRYS